MPNEFINKGNKIDIFKSILIDILKKIENNSTYKSYKFN